MKSIKNSFLFFYVLIGISVFLVTGVVNAQEINSNDSLSYYSALTFKPKTSADLTNSYAFFRRRSERSLKQKDTLNIIHDLRYIAIIQFELGLLKESETSAVSALSFIDHLKADNAITAEHRMGIYNHLGRVYTRLKDYPSALKYFKTSLELQKDPKGLNSIQNNIGFTYYNQANYEKALELFEIVHQTNLTIGDTMKIARSMSNIGMTKSKLKDPSGLDSLTKALQLRTLINYQKGIFDSYLKLGTHYQDQGDYKSAKRYIDIANQLAKKLGNTNLEVEALSAVMQLNPNANVQRYSQMVDSINEAKLNSQNSYAAKKYALEKQERIANENELQLKTIALDNERQKRLKISYLFTGILILLSAIFIVFYMRSKHKKEKLQEVYDTESRISKKVHDEVANDVFQLMTKLEHEDAMDAEVIDELHGLYYRTRDISKEHSMLNNDYPFRDYLNELIENFHDAHTNIIIKGLSDVSWNTIPEIQKTTIYKVLQELLINMKKHSQASVVVLAFQKEHKRVLINYSDNGIGSDLKQGNGLQNTENRIQAINGTITFETKPNEGFKVKITV